MRTPDPDFLLLAFRRDLRRRVPLWHRIYRTLWPRYCDCVCQSRFLYSSACSDHNVLCPDSYGWEYGYRNIYTDAWRFLWRIRTGGIRRTSRTRRI